jgi:hypothetical protein
MDDMIEILAKQTSLVSGARYPVSGKLRDLVMPDADTWAHCRRWAGEDMPITRDEDDTEGDGDINYTPNDDDEVDEIGQNAVVGEEGLDDD